MRAISMCAFRSKKSVLLIALLCIASVSEVLFAESDRLIDTAFGALNQNALESVSDPMVRNGLRLPPESFNQKRESHFDPYAQEESDKLNQQELDLLNALMPLLPSGDANRIPKLLIPFSDNLPPSERDLSVAKVVTALADGMVTVDGNFWGTSVEAWTPLIESKNPIYRYMALKGISRAVPEPLQKYSKQYPNTDPRLDYLSASEKFDAYTKYFDETDNHMRLELYRVLRSVPLQANLNYLKSQLSIYESSNELRLIGALKDAIENVERLLGSPPEGLPLGWNASDANKASSATAPEVEEVTEVVEEVVAPKPAIEETAEVLVPELIEEDVDQLSNWWLWLIGAVVVIGGLGLVLRRKG